MKYDHSMDFGSYFFPTEMGAVSKSLNDSDGLFEKKVWLSGKKGENDAPHIHRSNFQLHTSEVCPATWL